jgi:nicotinamidase-related amidase
VRSHQRDGGVALLLIDFINLLGFDGGEHLAPRALKAARRTAKLKARVKARGEPAIYANDNFGDWRAEFNAIVERCIAADAPGCALAEVLRPEPDDLSVLSRATRPSTARRSSSCSTSSRYDA